MSCDYTEERPHLPPTGRGRHTHVSAETVRTCGRDPEFQNPSLTWNMRSWLREPQAALSR
jgi:hypothetical protein